MLRRFPFMLTISLLLVAVMLAGIYSITVGPMNITMT
ncbi:MAG: iron ABC transporter permease, partial [Vibrio sp.]